MVLVFSLFEVKYVITNTDHTIFFKRGIGTTVQIELDVVW